MARLAYCSACDRNVPVVLRAPVPDDRAPRPGDASDLVCLDHGVRCTGALCPLFVPDRRTKPRDRSEPPGHPGDRRVRSAPEAGESP